MVSPGWTLAQVMAERLVHAFAPDCPLPDPGAAGATYQEPAVDTATRWYAPTSQADPLGRAFGVSPDGWAPNDVLEQRPAVAPVQLAVRSTPVPIVAVLDAVPA